MAKESYIEKRRCEYCSGALDAGNPQAAVCKADGCRLPLCTKCVEAGHRYCLTHTRFSHEYGAETKRESESGFTSKDKQARATPQDRCSNCGATIRSGTASRCAYRDCDAKLCRECDSQSVYCPEHRETACSVCGGMFIRGEITGECIETGCAAPICKLCAGQGIARCRLHLPEAREYAALHRDNVRGMKVKWRKNFEDYLGFYSSCLSPVSMKEEMCTGQVREFADLDDFRSMHIARHFHTLMDKLPLPAAGTGSVVLNRNLTIHMETQFCCRPARLASPGFDEEPMDSADLKYLIHREPSLTMDSFRCKAYFSPSGWTDDARTFVTGDDNRIGFRKDDLSVLLTAPSVCILDRRDRVARCMARYFESRSREEIEADVRKRIHRITLLKKWLSFQRLHTEIGLPEELLEWAFRRIGEEPEFIVKTYHGQLVIGAAG